MSMADQATSFFAKFLKPIIAVVVLALIGGAVYSYKSQQKIAENEEVANQLFILKKELDSSREKLDKASDATAKTDKKATTKGKKPAKPKAPSKEQLKSAYGPMIPKFEAFIKANQGHVNAVEGALVVSKAIDEYKDDEQVLKILRMGVQGADKENFLYGVAQSRIGELLEEQDKCDEAAKAWGDIMYIEAHSYMSESLQLKSGVCYEKVGRLEEAEKMYQKVAKANPNSSHGRMAKKFLMYIRYKKSNTSAGADDKSAMNSK